ncbi:MAG TPA: Zn-ribbon domain-containing OB-fold protein [Chloroflexota bacterium]
MKLIPGLSPLTEPYWAGARRGELLIQRCQACGQQWHPPLPRCPACHSADITWTPVSGRGHVYTYTVVYHATHVAMADKVPYISALVELEEGPRVLTNLRNCTEDEVRVGMPVRLRFEALTPEITLPQFEPAAG